MVNRRKQVCLVFTHEVWDEEVYAIERFVHINEEGSEAGLFVDKDTTQGVEGDGEVVVREPKENVINNTNDDRTSTEEGQMNFPNDVTMSSLCGDHSADDIRYLRIHGIEVDDDHDPAPENDQPGVPTVMEESDGLGFNGVDEWRHDGTAIFSKAKMKETNIGNSSLDMWMQMFPVSYLNDRVIPSTNKNIKGQELFFGELIRFIGI